MEGKGETSDCDDQSTKLSIGMKSGSIYTDRDRQMFTHDQTTHSSKCNDVVTFQIQQNAGLIYPEIAVLEDNLYIALQDNFYRVTDQKGKKKFIPRHAESKSQVLFMKAFKPSSYLYLVSIEKCIKNLNGRFFQMLHISLHKQKWDKIVDLQIYFTLNEITNKTHVSYEFKDFVGVDSYNRAILALTKTERDSSNKETLKHQLVLINLTETNRIVKKVRQQIMEEEDQQTNVLNYLQTFVPKKATQFETFKEAEKSRLEVQEFFKIINSEFGDMVLLIGRNQIHEIEILESEKMRLKSVNVGRYLNQKEGQFITDAIYITNGLRIIVLTSQNRLLFIESQQLIINQTIGNLKNYADKSKVQYTKVISIPGTVILVNKDNSFLDVVKQSDSTIYFYQRIPLPPVDSQNIIYTPLVSTQELAIQYMETKTQQGKVQRIILNSPKATFTDYLSFSCLLPSKHSIACAAMSQGSRTMMLANQKSLIVWRDIKGELTKVCETTFFQAPLKISIHPIGTHFILLFKQMVRFCHFEHSEVKVYFFLKIRNISEAKYVSNGRHIMVVDGNMINILDSWTFQQVRTINTFAVQINSITYWDQDKILVRHTSNKHLFYFQKNVRLLELKLQGGDYPWSDEKQLIIVRQTGVIEIYHHEDITDSIDKEFTPKITISKGIKFRLNEYATYVLPSMELGFLFVGTNLGYVHEIIWPIIDSSSIQLYSVQLSASPIIKLQIDPQYQKLYTFCLNGNIQIINLVQYIDGDLVFSPYIFTAKTRGQQRQKRQLCGRQYLLDTFTGFTTILHQQLQKNVGQLQFVTEKMKDDIEEEFVKSSQVNNTRIKSQKINNDQNIKIEIEQYQQVKENCFEKEKNLRAEINKFEEQFFASEKSQIESYQKQLLGIYKQNDRLKGTIRERSKVLAEERNELISANKEVLVNEQREKVRQLEVLIGKYQGVEVDYEKQYKEAKILNEEEREEREEYKRVVKEQVETQYVEENERKERLLGANSVLEKQIQKYHQRVKHFESLLIETGQQIIELDDDKKEYLNKRKYLQRQLKDKEGLIETKEEQLQLYLRNTETMKKVKNTHQYQLDENQKELSPIQFKLTQIGLDIKKMNEDIMSEYSCKVETQEQINTGTLNLQQLKKQRHYLTLKNLQSRTKLIRFTEELTAILSLQGFQQKQNLKNLAAGEYNFVDDEKARIKAEGDTVQRKKVFILKEIEQQEKRDQQTRRNKYEVMKYQTDNTTLVRQYNELTKFHRDLKNKLVVIQQKLEKARNEKFQTPRKQQKSRRQHSEVKLTPYQRYEQQFVKKGDTTETRVSRSGHSISFLKTLLKEVNDSQSNYEKMEAIRDRVRSFVNPELKMKKTIYMQKIMFDKPRTISDSVKFPTHRH